MPLGGAAGGQEEADSGHSFATRYRTSNQGIYLALCMLRLTSLTSPRPLVQPAARAATAARCVLAHAQHNDACFISLIRAPLLLLLVLFYE